MSSSALSTESLCFLRECRICYEELTDPRMLPCLHTFCFDCLKQTGRNEEPGEKMPCPSCQTDFTIPAGGIDGIPRNYFIENVIKMRKYSSPEQEEYAKPEKSINAKIKSKITMTIDRIINKFQNKFCSLHRRKTAEIYCINCDLTICAVCHLERHREHICFSAKEVGEEFRMHLVDNIRMVSDWSDVSKNEMQRMEERKQTILKTTSECETEILRHAQHIKELVDQQANKLVQELTSIKTEKLKEIETEKEEVEGHTVMLESYRTYANEIAVKSSVEICQHFEALQTKANDFERCRVFFRLRLHPTDADSFRFTPSKFGNKLKSCNDIIGKLTLGSRLDETIEIGNVGGGVIGMTLFENKIYVVCNETKRVRVFCSLKPFHELMEEFIDIPEMSSPGGMTSSEVNQSIFISEWNRTGLWKIQMPGRKASKLVLSGQARGLSTTPTDELLVVQAKKEKHEVCFFLVIYRMSDFVEKNSFPLSREITEVWHAVQLKIKNFIISFANKDSHSVYFMSELSANAQNFLRTFDHRSALCFVTDWRPVHFVIDGSEIYVSDFTGNKIIRLNNQFIASEVLEFPIEEPTRICHSRDAQQLIVGKGRWSAFKSSTSISVFDIEMMS